MRLIQLTNRFSNQYTYLQVLSSMDIYIMFVTIHAMLRISSIKVCHVETHHQDDTVRCRSSVLTNITCALSSTGTSDRELNLKKTKIGVIKGAYIKESYRALGDDVANNRVVSGQHISSQRLDILGSNSQNVGRNLEKTILERYKIWNAVTQQWILKYWLIKINEHTADIS